MVGDPVTAYLVVLASFAGLIGAMLVVEVLGRSRRDRFGRSLGTRCDVGIAHRPMGGARGLAVDRVHFLAR